VPVLLELIKEENSEVKLNVVDGLSNIASIVGLDSLGQLLKHMQDKMITEGPYRVRQAVF
jgi:hypothetical protein